MDERTQAVLAAGQSLFDQQPHWTAFYRSIFGLAGVIRETFTKPDELAEFQESFEYGELQGMLAFLRSTSEDWSVKRHARAAFFEFMAGWSIYVRDPRRYGWRQNMQPIPEPEVLLHEIDSTEAQRAALSKLSIDRNGQLGLFASKETNTFQRGKLSQIAKGFRYRKGSSGRSVELIESRKPAFIADLVAGEVAADLQVLVWTVFDAESDILAAELHKRGVSHQLLTGSVDRPDRVDMLNDFRSGKTRVLVSRAGMLGYGMNFQCCGSMIFSGWNDSYEAYYQAVRRSYRYGQTKRLRVHLPVISELEDEQLENIFHKQSENEAAILEMENNYIRSTRFIRGGAA
jgi:hypothetical protein